MRRRRILIISAACVLVGIGVVAFWPGEPEPEYNGRKLSEWLLYKPGDDDAPNALDLEIEAIRQIGDAAVPWLLKWARYNSPPWRWRLNRIFGEDRGIRRRDAVWFGFQALGPKAVDAIPVLTQMANDPKEPYDYAKPLYALSHIGNRGFPPVLAVLENPKHFGRATAAQIIAETVEWGTNRLRAVPALVSCLHADNYSLAAIAGNALEKIGADPNLSQADLAKSLSDVETNGNFDETISSLTRFVVRHNIPERLRVASVMALGLIGTRAREAVPALVRTLNDDDEMVQSAATNALHRIAPEALTNGASNF